MKKNDYFYSYCSQVFAWGQNNCGQVGTGSTANQPSPRKVSAVIGMSIWKVLFCPRKTCQKASWLDFLHLVSDKGFTKSIYDFFMTFVILISPISIFCVNFVIDFVYVSIPFHILESPTCFSSEQSCFMIKVWKTCCYVSQFSSGIV